MEVPGKSDRKNLVADVEVREGRRQGYLGRVRGVVTGEQFVAREGSQ